MNALMSPFPKPINFGILWAVVILIFLGTAVTYFFADNHQFLLWWSVSMTIASTSFLFSYTEYLVEIKQEVSILNGAKLITGVIITIAWVGFTSHLFQ